MEAKTIENLIIVGGGAAGLSAAIYAAREGLNPLLIASFEPAGELDLAAEVENYPGIPGGVSGPELIGRMRKQAEKYGTRVVAEKVVSVGLLSSPFTVVTEADTYYCRSLIIATGASPKWLGLTSEQERIGRGVSSCATCDGPLYRGKDVALVGGGDTAFEYALILAQYARKVYLINRSSSFRAGRILKEKVSSNDKVDFLTNEEVVEVQGNPKVTGVLIRNRIDGSVKQISVSGLFVAIGEKPNTEFLNKHLELDSEGYVITKEEVKTSIPGVFCAGDIVDRTYRQAVTAAGSGVKAFFEARRFLQMS